MEKVREVVLEGSVGRNELGLELRKERLEKLQALGGLSIGCGRAGELYFVESIGKPITRLLGSLPWSAVAPGVEHL